MKKIKIVLSAMAFLVASASVASAQNYSFGVVDMNVVMEKSAASKNIIKQVEEKRKAFASSIEAKEKELRAEESSLVKQKDSLSKEQFGKKREEFKKDVIAGHKLAQKNKAILDRGFSSAMNKLRSDVLVVVNEIANEKNYAAILTTNSFMMARPELDVTKLVIEKLDAKVKAVKIDWEAAAKFPKAKAAKK